MIVGERDGQEDGMHGDEASFFFENSAYLDIRSPDRLGAGAGYSSKDQGRCRAGRR